MRKLEINGGHLLLTTSEPLTIYDVTRLASLAVEAKIPSTAEVSYISVNYSPRTQNGSTWELSIAWRMPIPTINIEKEV